MAKPQHSKSEPSQRMLRVGEVVRHAMADLLSRGLVADPVLEGHVVTVPEVRMSPDLKLATVFVMPLGGKDVKPVLEALDRHKRLIRTELAHKANLRFAPDVRFRKDESFDKSSRVDAILNSATVRRDLEQDGGPDRP